MVPPRTLPHGSFDTTTLLGKEACHALLHKRNPNIQAWHHPNNRQSDVFVFDNPGPSDADYSLTTHERPFSGLSPPGRTSSFVGTYCSCDFPIGQADRLPAKVLGGASEFRNFADATKGPEILSAGPHSFEASFVTLGLCLRSNIAGESG